MHDPSHSAEGDPDPAPDPQAPHHHAEGASSSKIGGAGTTWDKWRRAVAAVLPAQSEPTDPRDRMALQVGRTLRTSLLPGQTHAHWMAAQRSAIEQLACLGGPIAVRELVRIIVDPYHPLRAQVADTLLRMNEPGTARAMCRCFDTDRHPEAEWTELFLVRLGEGIIPELCETLATGGHGSGIAGAVLVQIGPTAIPAVEELYRRTSSPEDRSRAAAVLAALGVLSRERVPEVTRALFTSSAQLRRIAAQGLTHVTRQHAHPSLGEASGRLHMLRQIAGQRVTDRELFSVAAATIREAIGDAWQYPLPAGPDHAAEEALPIPTDAGPADPDRLPLPDAPPESSERVTVGSNWVSRLFRRRE